MKKKIVSIFVCMLLSVTVLSVTGTEIYDEEEKNSFLPAPSALISNEVQGNKENLVFQKLARGDWYSVDVMTDDAGSFPELNPSSWSSIGSTSHCYAGTWAKGQWYAINDDAKTLGTIDTSTGSFNTIGNLGLGGSDVTTGLAYDPSSDTMYMTNAVGASTIHLYTVDLETADVTDLGSLTPLIIAIGCSMDGIIYATSISPDSAYIIDPEGPTAIEIGSLGIDLNYAQDAAFDKENGKFYASAYTGSAALYEINLDTGSASFIEAFPSGDEQCAFAIPFSSNSPPDTPPAPSGPNEGVTEAEYTFSAKTDDPEGDKIYYLFDWGDGTDSGWVGPYSSGMPGEATKSWTTGGDYNVKVKAKDEGDSESEWSNNHPITIVEGPQMVIGNIKGGLFKVSVPIENVGAIDASSVSWTITLDGGAFIGKEKTGTDSIDAGDEITIKSGLIIGFGKTRITVTADVPDGVSDEKSQNGNVYLFFITVKPGG